MNNMNLGPENETLEYKKSTGEMKEAVISIGAILNKHEKGELYFGVRNDGAPVGQTVSDKTLREISQAIANFIEPRIYPEINLVRLDNLDCIHVRFEGYTTPYLAYGIARIRVADEDKVMSAQELVAYIQRKTSPESAWERRISDYTIDQVPEADVQDYVEKGHKATRLTFKYTNKAEALNELFVTQGDHLLNAGMVLFCDSSYAELQMAIFAGTERITFLDIQRHHGSIFKLTALAEKYIMSNIRWHVVFDGSLQRKEIPEIPVEAIREALINSFCHKDYGACQSNEVAIYKDRVEIYNPGSFPEGYVPNDFIERLERPVRRNPLITTVLYYSRDVEGFGTGLKRIKDACTKAKCRFEFRMQKSGFVVVFYRGAGDLGETGQTSTPVSTPVTTPVTTPADKARAMILEACITPKSREELMALCKLKSKKYFLKAYIKPLLENGQLQMTIPDKPNSQNQKYINTSVMVQ